MIETSEAKTLRIKGIWDSFSAAVSPLDRHYTELKAVIEINIDEPWMTAEKVLGRVASWRERIATRERNGERSEAQRTAELHRILSK